MKRSNRTLKFFEIDFMAMLLANNAVSGAGPQTPDMQTERRPGVHSRLIVRRHGSICGMRRMSKLSPIEIWLVLPALMSTLVIATV
jgi:hypothetical protein